MVKEKVLLTLLIFFITNSFASQVISYPLQECYVRSDQFTLKVNLIDIPVVNSFKYYDYAHFSFNGKVRMCVSSNEHILNYSISPKSLNIKAKVIDNQLYFDIDKSKYLIVKINDLKELVIAADDAETHIPSVDGDGIYNVLKKPFFADATGKAKSTDAIQQAINEASNHGGGTVYIPSGLYYCGNIILKSNVSIYLEGGAVIRGTGNINDYITHFRKSSLKMDGTWFIYTERNAHNIKIYGRGIIDGNGHYMRNNYKYLNNILVPLQCSNFIIDGITFLDSGLWGVIPTRSNNVKILNTKHFNDNDLDYENDAVDIQECQHVLVKHSLAISEDDTYSTKTWNNKTDIAKNWYGNPEKLQYVVFDDCLAWSRCATFKVGFGVMQKQNDITFKNSTSYKSMRAIAVNHRWGVTPAKNIIFENIEIEGFWPRAGSNSHWLELSVRTPANLSNIILKNIKVIEFGNSSSILKGYDKKMPISHVLFDRIYLKGKSQPATSLNEMNIIDTNSFLRKILIK